MNNKIASRHSGFVLIVSLFILSFLSVLAITLAHYGHLSMKLTSRYKARYRTDLLARGVVEKVLSAAWADKTNNNFDDLMENWILKFMPQGESREQNIIGLDGRLAGRYRVAVEDEAGKLNLNTVSSEVLKKLFMQFGVKDAQRLASLVEEARQQRPFYTVQEMLTIKGMPAHLVLGEDSNDNGRLDHAENDGKDSWPNDNQDGRLDKGIKDHLTVFTDGKVNVNTASEEVLRSLSGINEDILKDLTGMREVDPLTSLDEIKDLPAIDAAAFEKITRWASVTTKWYRILVSARVEESGPEAVVLAVADRSGKKIIIRYWREGVNLSHK